MIWKPNVTVAAVIEQEGKYLLVEEEQSAGPDSVFNQPAGHLEPGESIIIQADWYSIDQIQKLLHRHRSPLVMQCIQDDLAGKSYPLELLTHFKIDEK